MAQIPDNIIKKINLFLDELRKNNIDIKSAILFGSYASGNYDEWSDIDLAIVSDAFTGDRYADKDMIRKYKTVVDWDISPLPFKQEDFENSWFVRDVILPNGVVIV
jgi:uncharacterized protein